MILTAMSIPINWRGEVVHSATVSRIAPRSKITLDLTLMSSKGNVSTMQAKGKARAKLVEVPAVECSRCHTKIPLVGGKKPPKRCPNRLTCNAVFYDPRKGS